MYEEVSGRSVHDIAWYATLALWKSVVHMEGNYKRAMVGASDDPVSEELRRRGPGDRCADGERGARRQGH